MMHENNESLKAYLIAKGEIEAQEEKQKGSYVIEILGVCIVVGILSFTAGMMVKEQQYVDAGIIVRDK